MDPRNHKLAKQLISYSVKLQPGEKIYCELKGLHALDLGKALIKAATEAGGVPFWYYNDEELSRQFIRHASQEQFQAWGKFHRPIMEAVDAYIAVRGSTNPFDLADVTAESMKWHDQAYWDEVHIPVRLKKKWCVLRYPNPAMAQLAEQPTETFADFYYDVCCLDYAKMSRAMDPLAELITRTDQVRITGPGTDLAFSIKGIGAVKCDGGRNIPDGEVYTAPVRDSMNGVITYNTATMRSGVKFRNIRFEVTAGKITQATCEGDDGKLNEFLDVDEGARYFGEFAFGVNPYITKPMLDTLFDEKIGGSFHLTPGNAYATANNGNKSALHWDIVCIQTPQWGGGEVYFDGVLIRKDGLFVLPELAGLNPDNLR
ncbi:MAG: aminopeptidase [Candidatus Krumholzibacteria bacterium]|jgi:aminopeptidase|nr:aminopeptidase [Candidatus Krumholzibacteria bacterium]